MSSGDNVAVAWGLSFLAGASTVLGALLVGFATPGRLGYLSFLEAFTAGVMLQVNAGIFPRPLCDGNASYAARGEGGGAILSQQGL